MYAPPLETCPEVLSKDKQWRIFGSELVVAIQEFLSKDGSESVHPDYQTLSDSPIHGFHVELAYALNFLMPVTTELCMVRKRFSDHKFPLHICLRISDSHGSLPLFLNFSGVITHDELLEEQAQVTGRSPSNLAISDIETQMMPEKMATYSAHRMENLIFFLVSHPRLWLSCPA